MGSPPCPRVPHQLGTDLGDEGQLHGTGAIAVGEGTWMN